jgi:Fe-S cluster assembly protein SufD
MISVNEREGLYLARFKKLEKQFASNQPSFLREIRQQAINRFADLGFPTTRNEEWKYTNVAPITRIPFQPVTDHKPLGPGFGLPVGGQRTPDAVFSNGRFLQSSSGIPGNGNEKTLPAGLRVGSLAAALADDVRGPALEQHLTQHASFTDHAFAALNTALFEDGALIEVPRDTVVARPIVLFYLSSTEEEPTVTHPRNLILAGRGSQATFVEIYAGAGRQPYFTNAVTELVAEEGAVIDYIKVEQESDPAFHIATLHLELARSATVSTYSIQFGGSLVREDVRAVLAGEGAEASLSGLYVTTGNQHVDNHTAIDHAKPHCASRELYKGVLDGHSTGVFNGKIIVRKDAQKTDSKQSNKNLLLSEDAVINTKPQLEIYADDVKCTHGATIGQIDDEAIFYLRSRGIAREDARALLTQAFANDVIGKIKDESLRNQLSQALYARL